jgi:hypothetical protein
MIDVEARFLSSLGDSAVFEDWQARRDQLSRRGGVEHGHPQAALKLSLDASKRSALSY